MAARTIKAESGVTIRDGFQAFQITDARHTFEPLDVDRIRVSPWKVGHVLSHADAAPDGDVTFDTTGPSIRFVKENGQWYILLPT